MRKITDIAKAIKVNRNLELTKHTGSVADGRVKKRFNGEEKQFWLTNSESTQFTQPDFLGNIIPDSM